MKIAIIGAGISGLASAFFLQRRNPRLKIEIFEKEAHVGGRLNSVHGVAASAIDTGCQYLSIEDEKIIEFLRQTLPENALKPLPGPILCLPEAWIIDTQNRFVVSEGMQSWCEQIVARMPKVKIHLSSKVDYLKDLWTAGFDKILVSCPGHEARALGSVRAGDYWPCLSLFFIWHNPLKEALEYFAYRDLVFRNGSIWLAHEGLKQQKPGLWTAQLSPDASEQWKNLGFEQLEDKLQEDLRAWVPMFAEGEKTLVDKKYWQQAFPAMSPDLSEHEAFEMQNGPEDGQNLYFFGDGHWGVGRVENALQSAFALAEEILKSES